MKIREKSKECKIISFIEVQNATATEPQSRFRGDLSQEFGLSIIGYDKDLIIQMSKEEMIGFIQYTIDHLLPEYHLVKVK
jgi:hypothetical protein